MTQKQPIRPAYRRPSASTSASALAINFLSIFNVVIRSANAQELGLAS